MHVIQGSLWYLCIAVYGGAIEHFYFDCATRFSAVFCFGCEHWFCGLGVVCTIKDYKVLLTGGKIEVVIILISIYHWQHGRIFLLKLIWWRIESVKLFKKIWFIYAINKNNVLNEMTVNDKMSSTVCVLVHVRLTCVPWGQ